MITVSFENRGKTGLADWIYRNIKKQITCGELKADEKIPSKRSLAEHLGVSVITVQNAYARLISEGYIYSAEKKGFFVTEIPLLKEKQFFDELPQKSAQKCTDAPCFLADFTSNITSFEKFPFSKWAHTMRRVLNSGDEKLLSVCPQSGVLELREAIADYLKQFREMNVNSSRIVIGSGTESLYPVILNLLGKNIRIAVENPGYSKASKIFELNGAQTVPVELDTDGMRAELLKKAGVSAVHISPDHNFPTGIVMPVKRRHEILEWASQSPDNYIIEDDYDSEFRFTGHPIPALYSQDVNDKVIYINTFSKTLTPSLRISYMILPEKLLKVFFERLNFLSCPVNTFEQYTLASFIRDGDYSKHIIRMKNYYRNLRNFFIQKINSSILKNYCTVLEEDAGLHFLLKTKNSLSQDSIKKAMLKRNIKISSLSDYYYTAAPETSDSFFIINYSGIKRERIDEIIKAMEEVLSGKVCS
jgi:GntR family transcriptional regulator/MocR family aminotransferase